MTLKLDGTGAITGVDQGLNVVGVGTYSTDLNVGGNLNVSGVLTYDDVTNIDSVGVVTARSGIHVTGGQVGIGTDNPTSALEIRTTTTNAATHYRNNASNGGAYFGVRATDLGASSAGEAYVYSYNTGINLLADGTGYIDFATGGTASKVRIDSAGNVGIGTDNPQDSLDVVSAVPQIRLTDTSDGSYGQIRANGGNLILRADEGNSISDSVILAEIDGDEKLRIKADGSLLHQGNQSNTVDNTDGDSGNSSGYPAYGATFNKNVSVNNGTDDFGQCMSMISHTKSLNLDGSTNHNMITFYNREGCSVGHIYVGYSTGGDGAVAIYKFSTFYGTNSITAELGPSSRSSDTVSVNISSSNDGHTIRVNGNGYNGNVTVGVVFLSCGRSGDNHYGVRYW